MASPTTTPLDFPTPPPLFPLLVDLNQSLLDSPLDQQQLDSTTTILPSYSSISNVIEPKLVDPPPIVLPIASNSLPLVPSPPNSDNQNLPSAIDAEMEQSFNEENTVSVDGDETNQKLWPPPSPVEESRQKPIIENIDQSGEKSKKQIGVDDSTVNDENNRETVDQPAEESKWETADRRPLKIWKNRRRLPAGVRNWLRRELRKLRRGVQQFNEYLRAFCVDDTGARFVAKHEQCISWQNDKIKLYERKIRLIYGDDVRYWPEKERSWWDNGKQKRIPIYTYFL